MLQESLQDKVESQGFSAAWKQPNRMVRGVIYRINHKMIWKEYEAHSPAVLNCFKTPTRIEKSYCEKWRAVFNDKPLFPSRTREHARILLRYLKSTQANEHVRVET